MKPIDVFGLEVIKCFDCPFLEHQNTNTPKGWCSKSKSKVYPNLTPPSDSCPFVKKVSRDSFKNTYFLNTDLTSIFPTWRIGDIELAAEYHLPTQTLSVWKKDGKKDKEVIMSGIPIYNEAMLGVFLSPIFSIYNDKQP